jgi:hypothetical protein
MSDDYRTWLWEKQGERCVKALNKHGFDAHLAADAEGARELILDMVADYDSFGFGGSGTVRALGIVEELDSRGKKIFDHWKEGLTPEQSLAVRLEQGRCDCFFCSANAVSCTGEIVNVDGVGNRTNAMTFGTKKVIIAAGMNKVRPDLESALMRVSEIAAPMRAKSLDMDLPCAETGICSDCNSPQRICRVTTILHRRPMMTDVSVVLINEELGF